MWESNPFADRSATESPPTGRIVGTSLTEIPATSRARKSYPPAPARVQFPCCPRLQQVARVRPVESAPPRAVPPATQQSFPANSPHTAPPIGSIVVPKPIEYRRD